MSRTKLIVGIIALVVFVGASTFIVVNDSKTPVENATSASLETLNPSSSPSVVSSPSTPSSPIVSTYTLAQIALHATKTDCWSAIDGKVYNITPYVSRHPGGEEEILSVCGKDGSKLFENQHDDEKKPAAQLAKLFIGNIK